MTKKKIFTIAGIAVGAVIVIGIVIWAHFLPQRQRCAERPK